MPRVLRFTLIGCGGLIVLVVLVGMVAALIGGDTEPSSPSERAERDEGVEGGGKEPEAKKPLEGEKAKKPQVATGVPDYGYRQTNYRELGNGTIVIDLALQTEATEEKEFRAIGQELKDEFRYQADALFVESPRVQMWVLIEERAKETYREGVVETPEYRDGVAVYFRE